MKIPNKKAKYKKLAIWTIAFAVIILLPDTSMYWQRFKLRTETLPELYKGYTELDSLLDDYYEVVRINGGFIEPVLQTNDSTIIIITGNSLETETEAFIENSWYKINLKGQLTDSLKLKFRQNENHHFDTFNDYILDTDQNTYNTWLINNNSNGIPIKNIADNKRFAQKEVDNLLDKEKYLAVSFTDTISGEAKNAHKLFFLKNKTWHYLITDSLFYHSSTYNQNDKEVKYTVTPYDSSTLFQRTFVHKEHWKESSFWNISQYLTWGTGNGSSGNGWDGTSYFQITMPKKNIYFKQFVTVDEDGTLRERFNYFIYKPIGGDYLLLNDIENRRNYLIRPKSKFN
ncbi:hypothetical protein [Sphingobacterium anhuiense]|uniref:Uncharacterized protein n=1 Tax=Sphingobacterium anhuiense TaxID=493780 RepID=A0ABW5YR10_9SPHI